VFGTALPQTTVSILIETSHAGERLDRFLNKEIADLSRSRIKALIETGCTVIDGKTIEDPNFRVKPGSLLSLTVPLPVQDRPLPQKIPLEICFEDEHLIVINKPAGMVVHPAAGNLESTLVNALLYHCGDSLSGIGGVKRPGIVHRIDKDTSGLIVAAKTEIAHHGMSEQFAAHTIERRYDAIAWGVPSPLSGTISGAIGRSPRNRKKMAIVSNGGKHAVTHYKVIKSYRMLASHISCTLETGRTHQIRVHMTSLGNSLIGDKMYGRGNKSSSSEPLSPEIKAFARQALHATVLGFNHPVTGENLHFEAPLPLDFVSLQRALEP
jgi:23S rRNA pseudouridine1911/1915/1917 synthase